MSLHRVALIVLAIALAAILLSFSHVAGGAAPDPVRKRIGDTGCTICHHDETEPRASGDAPPLAPSFADIAHRYRGMPGAEERLTRIVVDGANPHDRHWKDRLEFTAMGANAPRVSRKEARAYVRWILSRP